ncbi:hypothetical protein KVV02_000672 [Mortierella alpina]|uniref:Uncharacterized protein n=1 Tax=Mortierella alpina TaxID=64518 RepID=A0A9P7ZY60_MORAP|nr:hypothetical protein KVV02_000672 [Mortierella alpina]
MQLTQDQQRLIVRKGDIMSRVPGSLTSRHEMQGLRRTAGERLDQAMLHLHGLCKKDYAFRIESKLDYLIGRMEAPRYLAAICAASVPLRWTPVAQSQPMIHGAKSAHHQPSMTMRTIATTTITTATTTTTTTSLTIDGGFASNHRLGNVAAVCAEVQHYDQELERPGAPGIARKHQKQVSSKGLIVKEVERLAGQFREKDVSLGQEDALQVAMRQLDEQKKVTSWTVNKMVGHCRTEGRKRCC